MARRKKRTVFWVFWGVLVAVLLVCAAIVFSNLIIIRSARPAIISSANIPSAQVAIILGANLDPDGSPGAMLTDRLDAGLGLYYTGRVKKLLLSGNVSTTSHAQVDAMLEYVLAKGVPGKDVFTDNAGFDTYDSLYRAVHVYKVKDALVVTQVFHLCRAVYIAQTLGIDATGVPADLHAYPGEWKDFVRDWLAGVKAVAELHVTHPTATISSPALPITGDGRKSRS